MNGALVLPEVQVASPLDHDALRNRVIEYVESIHYASLADDTLSDLELDRATILDAVAERRLFLQMNLAYHRAARMRESLDAEANATQWEDVGVWLARGDELRNHLLVIFHKLTVSIAKHYVGARYSLEELVSEGNSVLLRALSLFDPTRGFRFSTYATYALRRRLGRFVKSAEHIRFQPVDTREAPPIPDTRRWSPAYEHALNDAVQWLESALYELSSRERFVLRCRFGWGREFEPRTLQEIGDELGVSRERVRQLEARALRKLRDLADATDVCLDPCNRHDQ